MQLYGFTKSRILIFTVLLVIIIGGLLVLKRNKISSIYPKPQKSVEKLSEDKKISISNTSNLTNAYNELSNSAKLEECHYFDHCFDEVFADDTKIEIARKYNVAETASNSNDIRIGLLKGRSIDVPGIGTGYIKNKEYLNFNDNSWYWEIGACSTNNRIFIDAVTGEPGPVHTYVYCGGVF